MKYKYSILVKKKKDLILLIKSHYVSLNNRRHKIFYTIKDEYNIIIEKKNTLISKYFRVDNFIYFLGLVTLFFITLGIFFGFIFLAFILSLSLLSDIWAILSLLVASIISYFLVQILIGIYEYLEYTTGCYINKLLIFLFKKLVNFIETKVSKDIEDFISSFIIGSWLNTYTNTAIIMFWLTILDYSVLDFDMTIETLIESNPGKCLLSGEANYMEIFLCIMLLIKQFISLTVIFVYEEWGDAYLIYFILYLPYWLLASIYIKFLIIYHDVKENKKRAISEFENEINNREPTFIWRTLIFLFMLCFFI